MADRLNVNKNLCSGLPLTYDEFVAVEGETIARSRSSATTRIELGGTSLVRKCYVYPLRTALKAALRNTLVRPSRAEREFRMLSLFGERMGRQAVPVPIAFGERRTVLLLREAFLLTLAVPDAIPLHEVPDEGTISAVDLGHFLAALHRAGLVHGSLFARNLLWVPDGSLRLVDLDHAQALAPKQLPPLEPRSRDLAFLEASLSLPPAFTREALAAYTGETGEQEDDVAAAIRRHRWEAQARIDRRSRVRPVGRSAE